MGTRAAFFIGDPRDLNHREWLGCIAYDGHPDVVFDIDNPPENECQFRVCVSLMAETREDFSDPQRG